MLTVVIVFLAASLIAYCLLAGADFGAGVLEIFFGRRRRDDLVKVATYAMGPVWEANHMWLILAVVLLFNGFPTAYTELSIVYHIPLVGLLIGVILRGCAFTFRHYDAFEDQSHRIYAFLFSLSSTATPFLLGLIAGSTLLGRVNPGADSFYGLYIAPWWNFYSVSVGVFTTCLFSYLGAIYLIDESHDEELRNIFRKRARVAFLVAVASGALVFLAAWWESYPLLESILSKPLGIAAVAFATLLQPLIWRCLSQEHTRICRILAAAQVALILVGWFVIQFPKILVYAPESGLEPMTFYSAAAPEATLKYLGYALIFGSPLIFPALYYLFHVFKIRRQQLES